MDIGQTLSLIVNLTYRGALLQKKQLIALIMDVDVKTASLQAPIAHEIYIGQPGGFEKTKALVCKLEKSVQRLK